MTRKFLSKNHTFTVITQLFGVLTVLIALVPLAQTMEAGRAQVTGADRPSGKTSVVSAPPGAAGLAQTWHRSIPLTDGSPVAHSHAMRPAPVQPDSNPLLFFPAVGYDSGGTAATTVAVADLNGDGKPDVIVANSCGSNSNCNNDLFGFDGTVAVLLGNGDGTLQPAVVYASGGETPVSVSVSDVNSDGKPDLIVANKCASGTKCNSGDGFVGIMLGNGDGTFQAVTSYDSGGFFAVSLAVADFNGDDKPDLVVAHSSGSDAVCCVSPALGVLLGNGDGTLQPAVMYGGGGLTSVAVGDVNGDHRPDLVVTSLAGDAVDIFLGNGDGTFEAQATYDTGSPSPFAVAIADLNGDGKLDLVVDHGVTNAGIDSLLGILLGNGDGTFRGAVIYDSGVKAAGSVAVSDVNGDGNLDLLLAGNSGLGVLLGKFDGTFHAALTYLSGGQLAMSVVAADLNGDGKFDLVAGNVFGNNNLDGAVGVLLNNTDIAPRTTKTVLSTSGSPSLIGQPVTFTARVTSTRGAIPDGEQVTFYDGMTALASVTLSGGGAAFTTSSLTARTHTIKVTYAGDATFNPSTGSVHQIVNKYPTTTALSSSSKRSTYGQAVTFTATVTPTGPYPLTGKVKFWDDTLALGSATLNGGVASLTTSKLLIGTHRITAQYLRDAANDTSTSSVLRHVVQ